MRTRETLDVASTAATLQDQTPVSEMHRVLPAELLNEPAGHGEHVEEPALALKVPGATAQPSQRWYDMNEQSLQKRS